MKRTAWLLLLLPVVAGCSSQSRPTAPPPAAPVPTTPTPGRLSRIDPNVVEETDTYVIRRLPKNEYTRVDERHVKHPLLSKPIEFFKEDDQYYYVSQPKSIPEEAELKRQLKPTPAPGTTPMPTVAPHQQVSEGVTAADFENLSPPRAPGRLRIQKLEGAGLPERGMWRASFVTADVNGDGIPDLVAPPSRLGDGKLRIWLGDGTGKFTPWNLSFSEAGKPVTNFTVDYGGVAVGDIDGDGHLDVACASHGAGLVSLFGDGKGGFEIVRAGLPKRDFSAQALALLDAGGRGKLDIVASRDIPETGKGVDLTQVRVYVFRGRQNGWEFRKDAFVGGFASYTVHAWDFDGDGKKDVLTASHYQGALSLVWRNEGNGTFSRVTFDGIEPYAYHFSTSPGTFGKDRAPAFADAFQMQATVPETRRASGVTLYSYRDGAWTRHRVWRKHDFKAYLYAVALGDLDGDGLDDVVFPDGESRKLRVFFQQPDGTFVEAAEADEPALISPPMCVRVVDLNKDGRLDLVVSETTSSNDPRDPGGWEVFLNRR